ncbi:MAG: DUF167 domain-containing protein [Flavobacteriales bacterium]
MVDIIIQVKAGSTKNQIFRSSENELLVKLRAKPIDGEANVALVEYLASALDIKKSHIEILKGATSRTKKIRLALSNEEWERIFAMIPAKNF